MSGTYITLLETKLSAPKAGKTAIDPAAIAAIIAAIIQMISQCKKPTPANLRRRVGNRAKLAWAIYSDPNAHCTLADAFDHANDVFDMADDAKDDELVGLAADCR